MITQEGTMVRIEGHASVEEAETLLEILLSGSATMLDMGRCTGLHTAVLQLVRASGIPIVALPADTLLSSLLPVH